MSNEEAHNIYNMVGSRTGCCQITELVEKYEQSQQENNRLLELCMYSLLPKKIYNRELDIETKNAFIDIIKNNLKDDTYSLTKKIQEWYDNRDRTQLLKGDK